MRGSPNKVIKVLCIDYYLDFLYIPPLYHKIIIQEVYSLFVLLAGKPTIHVSANDFSTGTKQVTLTTLKEESADFKLEQK
jgi:hypothetical protein